MIPKKLKEQLRKRGIEIRVDRKLQRRHIKEQLICNPTVGWYDRETPNIIYLAKFAFWYKSLDVVKTILHEYRHWIQFHRKKSLWRTYKPAEIDAEKYAKRALKYFS